MNAHFVKLNPRTKSKNCRLLIMTLEKQIYVRVQISLLPASYSSTAGLYETPFDAAEKYYLANGGGDYFNKLLFPHSYYNFCLFCRNYFPFPQKKCPPSMLAEIFSGMKPD
ncbi:hypothetical protein CEXT_477161 [Caerostris extrusa]|uniref:Uncharacterized protein n=1 Tax=Caerostris extrusa TaxID=172846 RepID=A0AAV4SZ68_CAEEX|nr:hypothetical protein CEXT_477161 [Caerostris extrusa]